MNPASVPILSENDWTPERLQSLFDSKIPEDFRLEYKGLEALPAFSVPKKMWDEIRGEIGKDATAFANSDGGTIIYGIKEKRLKDGRPIPEKFQPVNMAEISRDQLAQIIASNSEPTLPGVRILPVQVPNQNDPSQVCYVVVVPKSDTAHMAGDGRYYFRNEATTQWMRDWQVRDAMNRRKVPKFKVELHKRWSLDARQLPTLSLTVLITNVSAVLARLYKITINWPETIKGYHADYYAYCVNGRILGERSFRTYAVAEDDFGPFFPQLCMAFQCRLSATTPLHQYLGQAEEVMIVMFADDMPVQLEQFPLDSIPVAADQY